MLILSQWLFWEQSGYEPKQVKLLRWMSVVKQADAEVEI